MDYVSHTCKKCGCAFVAEDYTNAQDIPPHWRLCPECAEKAGIDYEAQKSWNSYSEARRKQLEKFKQIGIEKLKEYHQNKKEKQSNL